MDIPEAFIHIMYDSIFFTACREQCHQFFIPFTEDMIGIAVLILVHASKSRKVPVKCLVIIFTVSITQGHPGVEADDSLHSGANAVVQYSPQILFRIINIGKNRRHPYDDRDSAFLQYLQNLKSSCSRADVRFDDMAECLIIRCESHLNNTLCFLVNAFQQIQIPENKIGLRDHRCAEVIMFNDLKALLCRKPDFRLHDKHKFDGSLLR